MKAFCTLRRRFSLLNSTMQKADRHLSIGHAIVLLIHYPLDAICNLRSAITLAGWANRADVMPLPVFVVDVGNLHAIARCHGMHDSATANIQRYVADAAMAAGAGEKHQITGF